MSRQNKNNPRAERRRNPTSGSSPTSLTDPARKPPLFPKPAEDGATFPVSTPREAARGDRYLLRAVVGTQLCYHHHGSERAMRGASQSDAGGAALRRVANLARGGTGGPAPPKGLARALPVGGNDVLAGERTRRERQEQ